MVKINQFLFINYSFPCLIAVDSIYVNICSVLLGQMLLQAPVTASGLSHSLLSYRTWL